MKSEVNQVRNFYLLDSFASEKFKGNPTAVCIIDGSVSKTIMQQTAKEFNLPVTVFVDLQKDIAAVHHLYYFTTLAEIPACGHATLAAAKAVSLKHDIQLLRFITIEDKIITVTFSAERIIMNYPKYETVSYVANKQLIESLSITDYTIMGVCKELETLFIELRNPELLRTVQPDSKKLIASESDIKEVVITSRSDDEQYDYLLRSFCPWIGIDEDPVTGSVHSVLAGYWANKLKKQKLKAYQASERGGEVFVTSLSNSTELGGNVLLVVQGEIML
jgi:PhzF family phenazine biosynthesis protein